VLARGLDSGHLSADTRPTLTSKIASTLPIPPIREQPLLRVALCAPDCCVRTTRASADAERDMASKRGVVERSVEAQAAREATACLLAEGVHSIGPPSKFIDHVNGRHKKARSENRPGFD